MARGSDPVKVRQWKERLKRFGKSNQSVVKFCEAEGVSQPSFYQWKKKLAGGVNAKPARQPKRRKPTSAPAFHRVRISSGERTSDVTIRLPNGSVIEIRDDSPRVESLVNQLLGHQNHELAAGVR